MTIFTISKNLSEFINRKDFDLGILIVVVDNCITTIVLNNKLLFIGELKKTNAYGIVIVGSSNYKLTHISTMKLTLSNDDRNIIDIIILKVLFFITLPVIILSISQISLIFSHGH